MTSIILSNKPLVEAIFELRWDLPETEGGVKKDPHYPLLIGMIYDKIKNEYPFHEQLLTSNIPHEMAEYIVQHRFRKTKNNWPLIQLGPGIITVNDTDSYVWEDFRERIFKAIDEFYKSYPEPGILKINNLALRYIDAVKYDFDSENIFDFLRAKMKIDVNVYERLFNSDVNKMPLGIDLRFTYSCQKPKSVIHMRITRAKHEDADALIWETIVRTGINDMPDKIAGIKEWIDQAHDLADDWFFKLIEGELLERFK